MDINKHLDLIEALIDKEKPKYIYNFAAQSMVGQSWESPEDWFRTNTVSTVKLFNMLKEKEWLNRYIHISTPEVYGSCTGYMPESTTYNPSTPYATSRAAADMSLKNFYDVYQLPFVATRAANVYGAGQQLYRIIPKTILCALLGRKLTLHGGGYSERSFIEISDVSSATQKIGELGQLGETYHISTKSTVSIRQLVRMICEQLSIDFSMLVETSDDRMGKDDAYLLDSSKLRHELAWRDKTTLEIGIAKTIAWVIENLDILSTQPLSYIHKK
jgi:dTDP-glucose 4,6-dehydratase